MYAKFNFGILGRFFADFVKERVRPWRPSMMLVGVLGRSWCMDFGRRDWKFCSASEKIGRFSVWGEGVGEGNGSEERKAC